MKSIMKKHKIIISILLVFFILFSTLSVSCFISNYKKMKILKEPIQYGEYTIYPCCYKEGTHSYVTFSVTNKNGYDVIPESEKWLLRDFYEIGFAPQGPDSPPGVFVTTRDKKTLLGKVNTIFTIKGPPTQDDKGYVNLSDSDFLKKAQELEVSTSPEDLKKIYGTDLYYAALDIYYCFNDNYILRVVRDISVVVSDTDTQEIVYEKRTKQSGHKP